MNNYSNVFLLFLPFIISFNIQLFTFFKIPVIQVFTSELNIIW